MSGILLWQPRYSVGLRHIDEQHQAFFKLINAAGSLASRRKIPATKARMLLRSLNDYAFYHFATEEEYLERYRAPLRKDHAKMHDDFRVQIATFIEAMERPDADVAELFPRVVAYASDWLARHIIVEDKKCEPSFQRGNDLPLQSALRGEKDRFK